MTQPDRPGKAEASRVRCSTIQIGSDRAGAAPTSISGSGSLGSGLRIAAGREGSSVRAGRSAIALSGAASLSGHRPLMSTRPQNVFDPNPECPGPTADAGTRASARVGQRD